MKEKPLTDSEVGDRLTAAEYMLDGEAQTVRGKTALECAKQAIRYFKLALVAAGVKAGD